MVTAEQLRRWIETLEGMRRQQLGHNQAGFDAVLNEMRALAAPQKVKKDEHDDLAP